VRAGAPWAVANWLPCPSPASPYMVAGLDMANFEAEGVVVCTVSVLIH
jgi:hypothetical protein